MPASDFAKADLKKVVNDLSVPEAISLLSGVGFWHTAAVPRLGIPAIKVSDGPNGLRGNHFFMGTPAKCLPSATALGATWDPELILEVGSRLMAGEAKLRAASVILAPTVNIQRSPLGGRSFESFSEDPHLSGYIASAYINGIQKEGIAACIKHFVVNDQENDRMALDSILSDRALREIYLMPFMIAQKHAQPWAYMTAYNRLNGLHCSENPKLIKGILRGEWESDATTMSDWYGIYSLSESINAGLDLEMPGDDRWRTFDHVNRSIISRKLLDRTVRERARNVLKLVQKCAKGAPEILDGDGKERTHDSKEDNALMRKVASQTIVLLKNEGNILPLQANQIKKIAIIGPNAKARVISGGGSASLKCSYVVTPYDGITSALSKDTEVLYSEGAPAYLTLPTLERELVTASGEPGFDMTWHNMTDLNTIDPKPLRTVTVDETNIFLNDATRPEELQPRWALRLHGKLRPRPEGVTQFQFGLVVAGRGKLYVDGKLVIDNWSKQRQGQAFFGSGTLEERGIIDVKPGESPEIVVEFSNVTGPREGDIGGQIIQAGVRLGGTDVADPDELLNSAVAAAKEADVAIVVVGLNADWETEGNDRTTLDLPGSSNELVAKVAAANKKTIVVTQSGSAITMPWVDSVPALVHAWYLGNETGNAIADILFGKVNPSGKLSLTFPRRLEDVPSYGHFGSENGKVRYGEDIFVGYKHYLNNKISTLFPFGYGLSYTTFEYSSLSVSKPSGSGADFNVTVSLKVTNTGKVAGSETVQIYTSIPKTSPLTQVPRALKGFKKVALKPGESITVKITLDKYAVSYWEERIDSWLAEAGEYTVYAAASSEDVRDTATFVIDEEFEWNGL
ncbi:glycoside hydrolase family 3 protein [Sphaerobolus stellatus SS14]|uniref:beta-glucosidase n=1 Tax=Sphaerobolus stellatus (strain SS14) TaxID=990650 RepID=A0A0C9UJS5_SPHS4|nr:glycoside hydrolase family 3 protein [Sphaerobolus stellatus SS14]